MQSLRELQTRFASALLTGDADGDERIAIYRNTVRANYRNALGATYRVVSQLVGEPFFHAAVDAYAHACPSTGGDLNVYGGSFGEFLATIRTRATFPICQTWPGSNGRSTKPVARPMPGHAGGDPRRARRRFPPNGSPRCGSRSTHPAGC